MPTETLTKMTGDEMIALSKKHTLFEWSAQSKVDPIAVERAKGIYFWTPEGKRFIDFNSQLMCVNIGDRKSTRLNSSHVEISYAVFCLKKKNILYNHTAMLSSSSKILQCFVNTVVYSQ